MPIGRREWPFRNPPNVRFTLNRESPLSRGLELWLPITDNPNRYVDRIKNRTLVANGTPNAVVGKRGRALHFTNASSERLTYGGDVVGGSPVTMACWFKADNITASHGLISIGSSGAAKGLAMYAAGTQAGDPLRVKSYPGATEADTSTGFSADTWHHACGVFAAVNDRRVYLDGGNKGTDATAQAESDLDSTDIGAFLYNGIYYVYADASIINVCIWNRVLNDEEVLRHSQHPWELYATDIPIFYSIPVAAGDIAVTPTTASTIAATVTPTVHLGSATLTPVVASTIAATVAPAVEMNSLVITPVVADAIADVVNPDVIEGDITVTPVFADAIAETVTPTVELGSLAVTTVVSSAIADVIDPAVEMGSLIITPVISDAIVDVVNPAVIEGSLSLTPVISDAIVDVVAPAVELASMTITPVFAGSITDVIDPNVIGGDTSVTPVFAGAIVSTIAPTILYGSVVVTPVFAGAITTVVNPVVRISGVGADEALKAVYIGSHPKQHQKRLRIGL